MAEPPQRGAEQRIDGARPAQDRERAADDEDEEDDLGGRLEAARDGGEDQQGEARGCSGVAW
jgi:hypothetical protein